MQVETPQRKTELADDLKDLDPLYHCWSQLYLRQPEIFQFLKIIKQLEIVKVDIWIKKQHFDIFGVFIQ